MKLDRATCGNYVAPEFEGQFCGFRVSFGEVIVAKPIDKPVDDRLQDLENRLDKSLAAQSGSKGLDSTEASAAGLAMRAIVELMVGIVVGMVGGYYLDKYFGTSPWLMIGLMPVGMAAGVLNVLRLSNTKQAKEVMGEGMPIAPSVKDDDED